MSEASRQRYLYVTNRLEELAAKHGPPEDSPMPEWLDTLEGWRAWRARQTAQDEAHAPPTPEPDPQAPAPQTPQNRVLERPDNLGPKGPGW